MDIGVLTVTSIAGSIFLLLLVVNLVMRWSDNAYNTRTMRIIGVIIVGWIVGVGLYWEIGHQTTQSRLTEAVQEMTGNNDARVKCQRLTPALIDTQASTKGFVTYENTNQADLKRDICQDLRAWLRMNELNADSVSALHILTHETLHVAGEFSEAKAECYAIQYDSEMIDFLSIRGPKGHEYAQNYYATIYPLMPDNYKSEECYENGPLDLSPGDYDFFTGAPPLKELYPPDEKD